MVYFLVLERFRERINYEVTISSWLKYLPQQEGSLSSFFSKCGLESTIRASHCKKWKLIMGSKIKTKRWFRSRCLCNINSGASINSTALIIERSGDAHPQSGTVPGKISLSGINFRDRLIQLAQTERNKNFTPNPSRRNGGNYPKSWNTERRKITPNLERRNGGKSLQILKDGTINTVFSFDTSNG